MSLWVSRRLEDERIDIIVHTDEVFACIKLTEAQAVELADQIVENVDALALHKFPEAVLDDC